MLWILGVTFDAGSTEINPFFHPLAFLALCWGCKHRKQFTIIQMGENYVFGAGKGGKKYEKWEKQINFFMVL
jgi:hypothetical protein